MTSFKYLLFFTLLLNITLSVSGQDIVGKWKTIDDNSGKARSIIEIYKEAGKYYGKVSELILEEGDDPDPICDKCEDHRKDQKVIGMNIIQDMELDKDEYTGGEILDPENGKIYRCKLWLENKDELKVRGYLYFFFRTQTWYRVS